jgi:hypothetical protein
MSLVVEASEYTIEGLVDAIRVHATTGGGLTSL